MLVQNLLRLYQHLDSIVLPSCWIIQPIRFSVPLHPIRT
jgi:hypothetical protein